MKIIVTGALGHIGSRLIRELPAAFRGLEVVMIDNMLTNRYASLFNLPAESRYRFLEMNVLNADLFSVIDGADVVIHLAAITDAAGSFNNKEQVETNNFNATARVAEACAGLGCPMIHMSSTSVYGTQKNLVDECCTLEDLKPQSPYAETKLKEEDYLFELGRSKGLKFIVCRFGTICGISPGMRFHTAVNKFCWQAVMRQPLTVWTTALHQKRPYLSLQDAMKAYQFIIQSGLYDNQIYNVLTDNLTVNDIVQNIAAHIPHVSIKYVDNEIMNQLSYEVSSQRFMNHGFRYSGSIAKDIEETIALLGNCNHEH
ncbi:MAG: nucleoside-diphosphate sugar epimerase [Deltaproteobacteria bacterium HGW-Deltaproteobacteria-6]|jgi:nucleoside-diphosphate-sugar epimerase|nr:MAG: nucleoside-diphosphate sugar epimerase [Deltaproteobacteria bacterium HGW-Deltaproteobacteria-6]